jgi:hypothetical protein
VARTGSCDAASETIFAGMMAIGFSVLAIGKGAAEITSLVYFLGDTLDPLTIIG